MSTQVKKSLHIILHYMISTQKKGQLADSVSKDGTLAIWVVSIGHMFIVEIT